MKVLLIYPYFLDQRIHAEDVSVVPIGLYYIGALLKENGYDVEILNWHDRNKNSDEIKKIIKEKNPNVIGFSVVNANRWGAIEIAKIAKKTLKNIKIVFGGIGATFLCEHLLNNFKQIDYIVLGEGEYTFLDLLECIYKKEEERICFIKGIAFIKDGRLFKTEPSDFIESIDSLPMPAKYFTFQHVISSRGCPSNCTFCGSPKFWGRRVRFHSPEYFVEQMELLNKNGVSFFYVSDDTFTMKEDRVIQICRNIIERGLKINWFAISRVNFVSEVMLYWMRKAGCIQISYGVESGSEKIRQTLNKNIKTCDIKRAFSLTVKYGILPRAYFIYGSPGETDETIDETINLIKEIKPLNSIFYILDIFPGTTLYEDFQSRNKTGEDIWLKKIEDIMYFETDSSLSKEKILSYGNKLRTEFYKSLPENVSSINLIDKTDLYEYHADFLSRLAMTFSHGDYANIKEISDKENIAEKLFSKALSYYPDHRAFLGLGIIKQKKREYMESIAILEEARRHYPESEHIVICLGISYMNIGQFEKALKCFQAFPDSQTALNYSAACHRALGNKETSKF